METIQQFFYLLAGLAIFYFGQRTLSQGLQTIGASSVKKIVHNEEVKNTFINFWHGARLTVLSFSSTMSTLVISGLVNANLLRNRRVVPMMVGASLGASAIILILSFSGHNRGLNLIACGLIFGLVFRSFKYRSIGKFFLGLGLLFLGLTIIEESLKMLVSHQEVVGYVDFINQLPIAYTFLLSIILGLSLAIGLTSSTMVLALATVSAKFQIFTPFVCLGFCLGSILSSFLMTFITTRKNARSLAVRKSFVPLVVVLLSISLLYFCVFMFEPERYNPFTSLDTVIVGTFSVSLISLLLSFMLRRSLVRFSRRFYPDDEVKEQSKLQFLGEGRFLSSTMAYVLVEMEVSKLMDIVDRMFLKCREYIESEQKGARALAKIKDYERIIDNIQSEIDIFIQKVISNGAGEDDSEMSLAYLKLSNSLEQIADHLDKISTTLTKIYENWKLSEADSQILLMYIDEIRDYFKEAQDIFNEDSTLEILNDHHRRSALSRFLEMKKEILVYREDFAARNCDLIEVNNLLYFSDLLTSMAKLRGKVRDIYKIVN